MSAREPGPPPQPDDLALIAQHVSGDPDAFGEIFRRHRSRLWAVALRTTGNSEDAADALQDAMVKAFRSASSFRGDAAVTTWLHRVVVNACLDLARRRTARPSAPLPDEEHTHLPGGLVDYDPLQAHDLHLDVVAALATLPPEQRAALVLVDMQGFSVDETARILECAPGTVKSRCSRGRARLLPLLVGLRGRNQEGSAAVTSEPASSTVQAQGGEPA